MYVFGDSIDHLHLHLAPHHEGGPLNAAMIKGDLSEETLPGGAVFVTSAQFLLLPETELPQADHSARPVLRRP